MGKNTLWLLLSRLSAQGLMVLFTLLVARRLGEAGLGAYALIGAVVFFGNVLTTFGTDILVMRAVAARNDLSLLPPALVAQLLLAGGFVGLVWISAPALPNQGQSAIRALQWYSLALFPLAFYTVFSAALRGAEQMRAFLWLNLTVAALQAGLAWLLLHPGSSLVLLAQILLAAQFAVALQAAYLCRAHLPGLRFPWRGSLNRGVRLLRASSALALLSVLKILYLKMSIYLLSILAGAAATGLFSAALRVVEAAQVGHIALVGALFPALALAHAKPGDVPARRQRIFSTSPRVLLVLGVAVALLLSLFAPLAVKYLYSARFEPSIPALRLLAWTFVPYSVNIYRSADLLAAGRERMVALVLAASLLALAGLNAWWIPRWGVVGACWAALVAETFQAGLFLYLDRFHRSERTSRRSLEGFDLSRGGHEFSQLPE